MRKNTKKREKKYCNCAECGRTAVGKSTADLARDDELVIGGHIKERPWCTECLTLKNKRALSSRSPRGDDSSPGQEGAIRAMEDG